MVLVTALSLLLAAPGGSLFGEGSLEGRDLVAVVNGVGIPRSYWEREILRFEDLLRRQGQTLDDSKRAEVEIQALATLVDMELLYQESRRRGVEISPKQVAEQVSALRGRFPSDEAFVAGLEQMGFGTGELEVELERQLTVQLLIDSQIAPDVTLSGEEVRAYYDGHLEMFRAPEQVSARHILIRLAPDASEEEADEALSRIEEIRRRIVGGEDFAEVARELSEDASAAAGGELGWFSRDRMVPGFSEAAFSLPLGALSEPVRSEFGYHLIEVTERAEERVMGYEEVEAELSRYLRHDRAMTALDTLVALLREKGVVERPPEQARVE
jgi:peptidyl-prolyl cis-trans isomerase C